MKKYIVLSLAMFLGNSVVNASSKEFEKIVKGCDKILDNIYLNAFANNNTHLNRTKKLIKLMDRYRNSNCYQNNEKLYEIARYNSRGALMDMQQGNKDKAYNEIFESNSYLRWKRAS